MQKRRLFSLEKQACSQAALILSFVLPVVIMLSIFVIKGIYPFGDRSFLFSDMYHQYMPFFHEFLMKIKGGEGLAYSWNVGIGSNFLALYVYYLASPLHWLAFLVPQAHLMEFLSYLVVVKVGLCGLTATLYLRKHFHTKDSAVLLFSCFYALSGFLAAYNWNIMWLDCIILLPLIILGLEQLVREKKCGLYCAMLALSIFTNFYISIMICIFLVLYFITLLVTEHKVLRENGKLRADGSRGTGGYFQAVKNFALFSLLAGGMAAILLVPEVCAILATDFGDMDFPETLQSYFPVLDMLARHCLSVTTERGLEHWPNIYCGVAVFMLLPMYALNNRIAVRRRFCNLALAGFFLLSFGTNMLDFIWHGLNYPDSLPARQSFIYILLIITMCYEAFRTLKGTDKRQIVYGYLAAVVFLLCTEKFIDSQDFDTWIEVLTLVFVTIYAVLLYLYRTREKRSTRLALGCVALVAVIAEVSINTFNTSIGTTSRSAYLGQQEDYRMLYEWTREQEDGFYRLEKFTRKTKNDGTLTGYPTASVFSSTMNSHVMDLYARWGMRHSKVYYGYDGATPFTSALLNVKYLFGESQLYESSLFTSLQDSNGVYLYGCEASLPFGYVAPYGYDLPKGYKNRGIDLQNQMVLELGSREKLFQQVDSSEAEDNVEVTAQKDGFYYGMLTAGGTGKADVIGGRLETQNFNDLKNGSVIYLGYLNKGETVTVTNADDKDDTPKVKMSAYLLEETVLDQVLEKLSAAHLEQVAYDSRSISGRLTLFEQGRLILSVPYEKGWRVLLNGERVEPALFGGTLMAFDLEPGEYTLDMHYTPYGQTAGIVVSLVSIGSFAVFFLRRYTRRRRPAAEKEIAAGEKAQMCGREAASDEDA